MLHGFLAVLERIGEFGILSTDVVTCLQGNI